MLALEIVRSAHITTHETVPLCDDVALARIISPVNALPVRDYLTLCLFTPHRNACHTRQAIRHWSPGHADSVGKVPRCS